MTWHCGKNIQRLGGLVYVRICTVEEACIRQLFQSVERPQGRREAEARRSIPIRALGVEKGTTRAPTPRANEKCAPRFVTIPVNQYRASYVHHELGRTLQRIKKEKCQGSPGDIKKYGALTEQQMGRRSKVRRPLA